MHVSEEKGVARGSKNSAVQPSSIAHPQASQIGLGKLRGRQSLLLQ